MTPERYGAGPPASFAASGSAPVPGAVYLAPRGFEAELREELTRSGRTLCFVRGRLAGTLEPPFHAVWAENVWLSPRVLPFVSISDGARQLASIQRNWALFSTAEHRRAALIEAALPKVSAKPLEFGRAAPRSPLGSWTLWSRDRILASPACASPFPNGEVRFIEDKQGPPNRAYLKLWELFTRIGRQPGPGDLCLDLGSSPGGWSWVLARLGARVFSVDKAPLAPAVSSHPFVEHCLGSAFAVGPGMAGGATWLFSDVACYPDRLYSFVRRWIDARCNISMVCTIKLAGATCFADIERFSAIERSRVIHLHANKHELTWLRLAEETP